MSLDNEMVRRLVLLERQLDNLPRPEVGLKRSVANVSNPPTDAELDAAFPNAYGGFAAIVDDQGAGLIVWFVVYSGTSWWYEGLTKAV